MRIALGIVSLSERGGLQRDRLGLADALLARGHEVEVSRRGSRRPGRVRTARKSSPSAA
jgi:hypothetical protein